MIAAAAAACSSSYVVVTVDARQTVHAATTLQVTLGNSGSTQTDTLTLGSHEFPVTFTVDASGRTGDLSIGIAALDQNNLLVGQGSATSPLASTSASVTLDGADFVVNTDFAGDQELSADFEANGLQLGAADDGSWTVSFHETCDQPCDMLGRRFDSTGAALESMVAASTNQFALSTTQADAISTTALAGTGMFTMALWDFESTDGTVNGVACEHLDEMGNELDAQQAIATDSGTDVVSATPMMNGQYAVTWDALLSSEVIRGVVVDNTCTPVVNSLVTISTNGSDAFADRAHVASNGQSLLYAWIQGVNDVHVRTASERNQLGSDVLLIPTGSQEGVQHVRVASMADGYAVVVRWESNTETNPGRIELYKVGTDGKLQFGPVLISGKTGSDFDSVEAFGVATRADGAILVVWHACADNGDGQGCGVFGRIVRPTGVPVGDQFVLATTLQGDQRAPSAVGIGSAFAVAWNDASEQTPDVSGLAVRARVIAPPYDDARGVLGAVCDGDSPCGDGLICDPGSDGAMRCYEDCDPTLPPPTCPEGGTCMMGGCVF